MSGTCRPVQIMTGWCWLLGKSLKSDLVWNDQIWRSLKVVPIMEKLRESRLRWFGHVKRRSEGTGF